jgi:hypothetical protein
MTNNLGKSCEVDGSSNTIVRVRLTSTETGLVAWELSADQGGNWQAIPASGDWMSLSHPGDDLLWRATFSWVRGVVSSVSQLQIDWLYGEAEIDSTVDIPDDQGGWLRLHHARSGYDFADEDSLPISHYGVWRRVDDPALVSALRQERLLGDVSVPMGTAEYLLRIPESCGSHAVVYQDRTYMWPDTNLDASALPPGTWEWVATVPALQQEDYIAAVPTAADSTASGSNYTVLIVTAHTTTPSIWYVSTPDSACSVDNLAPSAPTGLTFAGVSLIWDECPDEDFDYFTVYGSETGDFGEAALVGYTVTPVLDLTGHGCAWYHVTATDFAGNESGDTSIEDTQASVAAGDDIPEAHYLRAGDPNPFSSFTSVEFGLPSPGTAKLRVFDVSGRLVATLVDRALVPGRYRVAWKGADNSGSRVSAGVYYIRLEACEFTATEKILLMR